MFQILLIQVHTLLSREKKSQKFVIPTVEKKNPFHRTSANISNLGKNIYKTGKNKKSTMSRYNANVRIGNWFYELILEEEKAKKNLKGNKDLKIQKTRQMFLFMLKEIPLTFPVVGLSYGAAVQIVSPEMPPKTKFKIKEKQGIALGADIQFKKVQYRSTFAQGDNVIGTGLMTPCSRNVWTLVPYEKSKQGKKIKFGDSFYMQIFNSSDPPLYLEAPVMSPAVPKGESGHVVPTLVGYKSAHARFKIVDIYPNKRFENEGKEVPPFTPVAIVQGASYASLAVEPDTWFPTYFGMECEVSVHTFIDNKNKNQPDPRNSWSFVLSA